MTGIKTNIRKWKSILCMHIVAAFCLSIIVTGISGTLSVSAATLSESSFASKISYLKTIYRDREYWNAYNACGYEGTGSIKGNCSGPCAASCSCRCGKFYLNGTYYGGQCYGFANKMGYLVFGSVPTASWIKYTSVSNYYAGDYVRIRNNKHSIFITKVSGDTITYVDCNNYGPCQVKWDRTISKASLKSITTYVYHLSGNNLTGTGNSQNNTQPSAGNSQNNTQPDTGNAQKSPVGVADSASGGANSITVAGWAYDPNDVSKTIYVDIYVGGPADSGAPGYRIVANKERTDVGKVYGVGNNHGFSQTLHVDCSGTKTLYFYAIGNGNPLIGTKTVNIKQLPVGSIDEAKGGVRSITVGGWAYDPDEPSKSVDVHVYVGGPAGSGAPGYAFTAKNQRTDVGNMFGVGNYHGYSGTISTELSGTQTLYFYIIDSEGLDNKFLGTKDVTIASENEPVGYVDYAVGGTDSITVGGWAYDEDDVSQPLHVHVYIGKNGPEKFIADIVADKERTDVGKQGVGNYHGFSDVIQTDITGTQTLYFFGIDIGGKTNLLLDSKEVEIKQGKSPVGSIDLAAGSQGSIRVGGWALDEDVISKSIFLHVYIGGPAGSGAPGYVICADKERTDVGKIYAGAGNYHGYDEIITTNKRGKQEVYIYGIDEGSSRENAYLGHCTVTIQDAEVSEEHMHKYTETVIRAATCTNEGEKQYICDCGDAFSEIIEKTFHTIVTEEAQAATCTEDGVTEKSYCSVCGTIIKASEIVEKSGHKNTEVRYQKNATCSESGYTGDVYCTDCGMKVEDGIETESTEHNWDDGIITKYATDTETGIKTFTCMLCEMTRIETIPLEESKEEDNSHTEQYPGETTKPETIPPTQESEEKEEIETGEDTEELEMLYEGDIVYDDRRKAEYEVVSIDAEEISVEYVEPLNKKESNVVIPDKIETEEGIICNVTAISAGAFQNNNYIKKVTVGNNVVTIGKKAFSGCKNLTGITLGANLVTIGNNAFGRCSKLKKLILPAKVSKIGSNAFYNCKKLKTMIVMSTKITVKGVAKKAFNGMSAKLSIQVPKNKVAFYKRLFHQKGLHAKAKVIAKKG